MRHLVTLLAAGAVVVLPAAALAQQRYLNPRDVQEAQQQHSELVQEFGGAETGARGAYVENVGRKVAAYSGVANPGQSFRFTTLNSAVENAFAVPGGYVYITRQLMGLMDDESELAFVLGHEAGHIAANHAQQRKSAQARNSILGALGAILGSAIGGQGLGNLIMQGSQAWTLSFSRDQEYQADTLGTRYVTAAGYDPLGGARVLAAIGRADALSSRIQGQSSRSTPEWASTHPLSANRVQRAQAEAQRTGRAGQGARNRDAFLAQLDGVYVDDDPAQGIIDGRRFTHPDLMMQFVVPVGYQMQNSASAVTIGGSAGKAQFSGGRFTGSLDDYVQRVAQSIAGRSQLGLASPPQRANVNGLPTMFAIYRANSGSGAVDLSVMAYQWDRDTVYHFVTLTRAGQGFGPFTSMIDSLRRISRQEANAIRPRIIDVVTVAPGDTVQSLARRMAYPDFQVERFTSLNNLQANSRLAPGQKVKLIVYGVRRG